MSSVYYYCQDSPVSVPPGLSSMLLSGSRPLGSLRCCPQVCPVLPLRRCPGSLGLSDRCSAFESTGDFLPQASRRHANTDHTELLDCLMSLQWHLGSRLLVPCG